MKNKILAAFTACAIIMSFSGCGEDTENISDMNSMTQSTNSNTDSSAFESSTSDLTGSDSETSDTDKQEQLEKIPMTEDELEKYYMEKYYCQLEYYYHSDTDYKPIDAEFDITEFINSGNPRIFELLVFWCDSFDVDPDRTETQTVEYGPNDTWEEPVYIYSAKTIEKIIRKIIPDYNINRVDYKKWDGWDDEKNAFSGMFSPDGGWIYSLPYKIESGYKLGDEVYLNVRVDYENRLNTRLRQVSRNELIGMGCRRLKQFRIKDNNLMSVKNIDEYPEEWFEAAVNIYDTLQNEGLLDDPETILYVMDGNLGKRICRFSTSFLGSHRTMATVEVYTYGARGKGDVITFNRSHGSAINYTAMTPQEMWTESYSNCTIEDKLKGEKYDYSYDKFEYPDGYTGKYFDETPETYMYNDKEISEDVFNSAELVKYFDDFQSTAPYGAPPSSLSDFNINMTVGEFFEICRIIAD